MKIKFLQDYVGRETAMKEVKKDDVLELDHQPAIELIHFGIAEEVGAVKEVVKDAKIFGIGKKKATDGKNS